MNSILITNVYSTRNKGDQALFESLVRICRPDRLTGIIVADRRAMSEAYGHLPIVPVPWETRSRFALLKRCGNVLGIGWFAFDILFFGGRLSSIGRKYRQSTVVVACAGGYLEDTSVSFFGMIVQIWAGATLGKRVILAPQSIGPFRSEINRRICNSVLAKCEKIFLRERLSLYYLSPTVGRLCHISPDLVLSDKLYNRAKRRNRTDKPVVGVTLVDAFYYLGKESATVYVDKIVDFIDLLEEAGCDVEIVTQTIGFSGGSSDEDIAEEVLKKRKVRRRTIISDLEDYLDVIGQFDAFCGSRLHSCLFALKQNVPVVCLSYQPKSDGIFKDLGFEEFVRPIVGFDPGEVAKLLIKLIYDDNARSAYLEQTNIALSESERLGVSFCQEIERVVSL